MTIELTEPRKKTHHRVARILGGFAVALLLGSYPAKPAAAVSCYSGEKSMMIEPVVELIDGPGDPLEQRMWWSERDTFLMEEGKVQIHDDDYIISGYDLRRIP